MNEWLTTGSQAATKLSLSICSRTGLTLWKRVGRSEMNSSRSWKKDKERDGCCQGGNEKVGSESRNKKGREGQSGFCLELKWRQRLGRKEGREKGRPG